jgi:hypothetical protein
VFVLRVPLGRRLAALATGFGLASVLAVGAFPSAAFAASTHPGNSHADKTVTQLAVPTVVEQPTPKLQPAAEHRTSSSAQAKGQSAARGNTTAKGSSSSARRSATSAAKHAPAVPLTQPPPLSHADTNHGGANGQCPGGPYCSTRDGSASGNGNGNGKATGKPCAGCVGKADNKNPKGQLPGGSDHNNGYECDGNHGVARSNPAHTACTTPVPPPPTDCVPTADNDFCGNPPPPECVPTADNNFCGNPPPPECVPTADNNFCGNPPPECVPSAANDFCVNPPPTECIPSEQDDSCGNPPPACVPGPGEDKNCVAVQGTKIGPQSAGGTVSLAHTGADLGGLLVGAALLLSVGIVLVIGSSRRRSAR